MSIMRLLSAAAKGQAGSSNPPPTRHFLPQMLDKIDVSMAAALRPFRSMVVAGQGSSGNRIHLTNTGEATTDGRNYPILIPYSSPTVGGTGGPAVGDRVLVVDTTPGNSLILGKIVN